jgi:hypothetical protein
VIVFLDNADMKNNYIFFCFLCILTLWVGKPSRVLAQNGIIGDFGAGWASPGNIIYFLSGAGTSRIQTIQPPATGDRYFRIVRAWSGDNTQFGPAGCTDANWTTGVNNSYNNMPTCGSGAFFINCPNTTDRYIFKTRNPDTENDFLYFRVQGTVRSVSSVTQSPTTVLNGNTVTITATLDGTFATGQSAYLRYSTNSFATSTVVEMTGSGTTYTATIPAGTNTTGTTVRYYVFTSGNGINTTTLQNEADYYTINLNNNGGTNYSYTVISGFATAQDGLWSVNSTWASGSVPPDDANVVINHIVTLNQNAFVTDITLNGTLTSESGQARQLTVKGNLTNNGTFTANDGTVFFSGGGTRNVLGSAVTTFNHVETSTTVDFVATNTAIVNGTFTIKNGGNVSTASAPFYANGSTLKFDTGGSIYAGEIWYRNNASGSSGVPKNVTIANGTNLNFGSDNQYRQMDGNFIIETGATFTNSTSGFGDLYIQGNLTNNGTFTHNGKGIFFNGTSEQTISHTSAGTLAFGYFIINKPSATNVKLLSNINLEGSGATGNVFEIRNTGGLDLNDKTVTFTNNGTNGILTDGGSRQVINSGAGEGIFEILATTSGAGNIQANMASANGGTLTFGVRTKLSIRGTGAGTGYSILNISSNMLTIQNILEINNRGALEASGNAPNYASGSILRYNSTNEYIRNKEWNANSGAGYPHHVEITNNTYFCLGGNSGLGVARTIGGNLTIANGSTLLMGDKQTLPNYMTAALSTLGNVDNAGTLILSTQSGGDLNIGGNFTNSGTFTAQQRTVTLNGTGTQVVTANASTTFYNLTINKSAGLAQLAGSQTGINVTNLLKLDGANTADLDLNYKNVNLGTTGSMLENRAGNVIVVDNTSGLTDYNKGGGILLTGRTIPTSVSGTGGLAGTGLELSAPIAINNLSISRYHYRGAALSFNAGIRKIYGLSSDAFGTGNTVTLRIYYATQEVPAGITPNEVYRWSSLASPNWQPYTTGRNVGADNVQVNSITQFSSWTLGMQNLLLPVSIAHFEGKKISETQSQLDWRTVSETNNRGFYVEKSYNGQDFETIGFVEGVGNSQIVQPYKFMDNQFLYSAYYRLKQTDFHNNISYSPIIWIENGIFRLYPNPVGKEVTLILPTEATAEIQLNLFDVMGRQVSTQICTAQASSQALTESLSILPAGAYRLVVKSHGRVWQEKIIKL